MNRTRVPRAFFGLSRHKPSSLMIPIASKHPMVPFLYDSLEKVDAQVYNIIQKEKERQFSGLELIASENFTSVAVMEANGSVLTNKYSEGLPGARYYGGNEHIDELERICQQRALEAFNLNPSEWGVNVQPYSGSTANFAALTGLIGPNDRIMGLDLPSGGHLTHGYQTSKKKISSTSVFFQSMPYQVVPETGLVDYDGLERNAKLFHPKVVICGGSAYPREWDYARLRSIANECGAYLLADIAHISGLVATGEAENPFGFCDIVTSTTHKTLRGPRAGIIFFKKVDKDNKPTGLEERINGAVFPGCQGGPHNNTIAAMAVALRQVMTPEFKVYAKQVKSNSKTLANALKTYGYKIASGGTDNHIVLWDLRPTGLSGSKVEKVCELAGITLNKNSVHGDQSAVSPGGVRLGTPALTTRGFKEADFEQVAAFLHEAVAISLRVQQTATSKLLKDFLAAAHQYQNEIEILKDKVQAFAKQFPLPGYP